MKQMRKIKDNNRYSVPAQKEPTANSAVVPPTTRNSVSINKYLGIYVVIPVDSVPPQIRNFLSTYMKEFPEKTVNFLNSELKGYISRLLGIVNTQRTHLYANAAVPNYITRNTKEDKEGILKNQQKFAETKKKQFKEEQNRLAEGLGIPIKELYKIELPIAHVTFTSIKEPGKPGSFVIRIAYAVGGAFAKLSFKGQMFYFSYQTIHIKELVTQFLKRPGIIGLLFNEQEEKKERQQKQALKKEQNEALAAKKKSGVPQTSNIKVPNEAATKHNIIAWARHITNAFIFT